MIIRPLTSIFGVYLHCRPLLLSTQVSDIGPSWSSCFQMVSDFICMEYTFLKQKICRYTVKYEECSGYCGPKFFTTQSQLLTMLKKKALENTVGKEENAGNQHFSFFITVFSTLSQRGIVISAMFNLLSANTFNLVMSKNLSFGKELTHYNTYHILTH